MDKEKLLAKKIADTEGQVFGCRKINPAYCRSCRFANGQPPFEDGPEKAYCMIYSRAEGEAKPEDVYYDGARCDYYEKDKRPKKR